jgi:hypothetical protein|nr:MAG TPA: hypothetical protein [Siphoviridae sp. ctqA315]DAS47159.1 MAG TPA: hypothetical protein [Caudoviricetes sp.]
MTELFIDGVSVVLPKGFSVQVKRENPFVTKSGEYTYDITLPLTNAVNAEVYKNINRLNSLQQPELKRSAVLVADNRVYCNGTEVITGWTESTVSIQVASGNSELNYFIGNDLLISFLKMKETVPKVGDLNYITKSYPEIDYCLAPIVNKATGHYINQWGITRKSSEGSLMVDGEYWYPLPYLCAYIKEVLQALGYKLTLNQLEETVHKDVCICPNEETCKWNEMLPGWSVKDFLEQLEKLYNVVFVLDNRKRTARLMLNLNYYAGMKSVHVMQVKDIYEVEVEEELDLDTHETANICYKFPDTAYWRWRCLPEDILKSAKKDVIPVDFVPREGRRRLQSWFEYEEHKKTDTIYTDLLDGRQYLFQKNLEGWVNEPVYSMLNEFAALEREGAEVTIELEIMPAGLEVADMGIYTNSGYRDDMLMYLPAVGESGSSSSEEGNGSLAEMIENNVQDSEGSKGNINLAFYSGLAEYKARGGLKYLFPILYIDEYRADAFDSIPEYYLTNNMGASFRPISMDKLFYQGGYDIDYSKGVKIEAYDPNVYDTRLVFEIRNKRYICKDMEFTLDISGRKGAWTGTFYPIHISDTEADARWILTDGKWRDGGVWLDNGRWLDN